MPVEISVIVPFYNERQHLARCARALVAQTYPQDRYEVLLIDNASTDGSADLVRDLPVTLLHEPVQSSYAARNLGVRHARGHILAFTDGDCEVDPRWLEHIAARFCDPELALLIGERRFARDDHTSALLCLLESDNARRLTYGYTNNLAVRREVFDVSGPFEEISRGADTNLFRRVKTRHPNGVIFAPEVSVRHLELSHLGHHLQKQFLYGRATRAANAAARERDPDAQSSPVPLLLATARAGGRVFETARRLASDHGLTGQDQLALTLMGLARYAAIGLGRLAATLTR